jgi:polysaccharide deacetylase family protein (PEP-CTERM system associated)
MIESIFSVDVEDWFHILDVPGAPALEEWGLLPSRVEGNYLRLLDLLAASDVRATCFFLGWVAERFPALVKEAVRRGHEVASHGYAHRLVYEMSRQEFTEDALRARRLLEDIAGAPVEGYRSAGFSITGRTPWFFEALSEAGYRYDSSVFPSPRAHGGMRGTPRAPYKLTHSSGELIEFPITVTNLAGRPMCFFGGGYLRLFPYALIRRMGLRVLKEGRPIVFYIHPREIDPDHPRLHMNISRRFKTYVNLRSTQAKLEHIFTDFRTTTFRDFLARHGEPHEASLCAISQT